MQVGVGWAGQEHLTVQIFDRKATAEFSQQLVRGADRQDVPAIDGDGRYAGLLTVQSVN